MVEGIGNGVATCPFLKVVIADFRSGIDSFLYIARLKRIETFIVIMCPYPGIIIGLQFKPHADFIGLGLTEVKKASW